MEHSEKFGENLLARQFTEGILATWIPEIHSLDGLH